MQKAILQKAHLRSLYGADAKGCGTNGCSACTPSCTCWEELSSDEVWVPSGGTAEDKNRKGSEGIFVRRGGSSGREVECDTPGTTGGSGSATVALGKTAEEVI